MPCYSDVVALVDQLSSKRDPYNHHAPRVAELAVQLAEHFGLSKYEIEMIRIGASLHDIGKLLVRDDILNVPRRLTKAEFAMVKIHPLEGFKVVQSLKYDPIIQDIVLHHHERLDGSGYPDRLKGEAISLHARIVKVTDCFEAMTARRPYRRALGFEKTKMQMEAESGSAFDPLALGLFFAKVVQYG